MDRPPKKMKLKYDADQYQLLGSESGEDAQERNPSKVLEEGTQKIAVSEAVLQEGECDVTGSREHNHTSEPDFETVEIPPIYIDGKSKQEVVEQREGCTGSNTVCGDGQQGTKVW